MTNDTLITYLYISLIEMRQTCVGGPISIREVLQICGKYNIMLSIYQLNLCFRVNAPPPLFLVNKFSSNVFKCNTFESFSRLFLPIKRSIDGLR